MDTFKIKVPVIKGISHPLSPRFCIFKFQNDFKSSGRKIDYQIYLYTNTKWPKAIDWIAPEIKVK